METYVCRAAAQEAHQGISALCEACVAEQGEVSRLPRDRQVAMAMEARSVLGSGLHEEWQNRASELQATQQVSLAEVVEQKRLAAQRSESANLECRRSCEEEQALGRRITDYGSAVKREMRAMESRVSHDMGYMYDKGPRPSRGESSATGAGSSRPRPNIV